MSRQWLLVAGVIASLAGGATLLARYGPGIEGVSVGTRAPDFRMVDLATGDSVSLRERYRGSVTLVNIWATWCEPCKIEMPAMEKLYLRTAPKGFAIAAVSIDEGSPED